MSSHDSILAKNQPPGKKGLPLYKPPSNQNVVNQNSPTGISGPKPGMAELSEKFNLYESQTNEFSNLIHMDTYGEKLEYITQNRRNELRAAGALNLAGEAVLMVTPGGKIAFASKLALQGSLKAGSTYIETKDAAKTAIYFAAYATPLSPLQFSYHGAPWEEAVKKLADKDALANAYYKFGGILYDAQAKFTPVLAKFETGILAGGHHAGKIAYYPANIVSRANTQSTIIALKKVKETFKGEKDKAKVSEEGYVFTSGEYNRAEEVKKQQEYQKQMSQRRLSYIPSGYNTYGPVVNTPTPPTIKYTKKTYTQITTEDIKKGHVEGIDGGEITAENIIKAYLRLTLNPWVREWKRIKDPELDLVITNAYKEVIKKPILEQAANFLFGGIAKGLQQTFAPSQTVAGVQVDKLIKYLDALEDAGGSYRFVGNEIKITVPRGTGVNGLAPGTQGWKEELFRTKSFMAANSEVIAFQEQNFGMGSGRNTKRPQYIQFKRIYDDVTSKVNPIQAKEKEAKSKVDHTIRQNRDQFAAVQKQAGYNKVTYSTQLDKR